MGEEFGLDVFLFGITNEGSRTYFNCYYPEGYSSGDPNTVISMVHHHMAGEPKLDNCEKLIVYTDSCSGQNRNRFLYSYLIKRVLAGYHNEVSWNFMVVGHTQFSPDRGFGLMRKHVERRDAFTAPDPVNINNALTPKSNYKCVGREAEVAEFRDFKRCITDNLKPVDGIKSRDIAEIIIRAETVDAHRICRSFRRYIRSDELQEMPVIKRARTAEERALGEHLCLPPWPGAHDGQAPGGAAQDLHLRPRGLSSWRSSTAALGRPNLPRPTTVPFLLWRAPPRAREKRGIVPTSER